ncbi:hypothetical protein LZD49_15730 [Dyadobacter sp. CY261]|uniref:nucleotide-binding domain-containing protein n=1 Tax=Dyadobacter sp. CY261 TaxID=2907203 RepID=UPI001F485CF3|nr:hypothetical protein [Dyadobacter sp. CY261]MCF0071928.1 hypothetical protein [Dyadobacter sp. CY261]
MLDLTSSQKDMIKSSAESILISLENIDQNSVIETIIKSGLDGRSHKQEEFLFDQKIPTLIDPHLEFSIDGFIATQNGFRDFRARLKNLNGIVDKNNRIDFKIIDSNFQKDSTKWKVKNDNNAPEPRGEISDHKTLNNPEKTAYLGHHYVECYAIKNNICIAKDRVEVVVRK